MSPMKSRFITNIAFVILYRATLGSYSSMATEIAERLSGFFSLIFP